MLPPPLPVATVILQPAGSDLIVQFGAASGFPGMSSLKSFRCPNGMDPQRVLVPSVASVTDSGRGVFNVDALVVFLISPDAGFDFAQLERAGLSKTAVDAAGLVLPKVDALRVRVMCCGVLRASAYATHAMYVCVAVRSARS